MVCVTSQGGGCGGAPMPGAAGMCRLPASRWSLRSRQCCWWASADEPERLADGPVLHAAVDGHTGGVDGFVETGQPTGSLAGLRHIEAVFGYPLPFFDPRGCPALVVTKQFKRRMDGGGFAFARIDKQPQPVRAEIGVLPGHFGEPCAACRSRSETFGSPQQLTMQLHPFGRCAAVQLDRRTLVVEEAVEVLRVVAKHLAQVGDVAGYHPVVEDGRQSLTFGVFGEAGSYRGTFTAYQPGFGLLADPSLHVFGARGACGSGGASSRILPAASTTADASR